MYENNDIFYFICCCDRESDFIDYSPVAGHWQRPATGERAPFPIPGQQAARRREQRGRRGSSTGDRAVGV